MTNSELKAYAKERKVFQYEIAERLNMAESKLSTLFRKPIHEEMQRMIVNAVDALAKEHNTKPQQVHSAACTAVLTSAGCK